LYINIQFVAVPVTLRQRGPLQFFQNFFLERSVFGFVFSLRDENRNRINVVVNFLRSDIFAAQPPLVVVVNVFSVCFSSFSDLLDVV